MVTLNRSIQQQRRTDMPIDIDQVKKMVTSNLSQTRSVKEIATKMNVSIETLRKDFRRKEHEPLSNFITRERLKEMKQLLLTTDLCCNEVCYHLGLRDDSGQKFFRRETGMSMEEFRLQYRKERKNNVIKQGLQ
jgi:AraC-like DNA-binding protein